MKRILALNFFPAFVPVSNGGESRVYNFYKALSKHHHVTLLSSSYPDREEEVIYHTATFVERRIAKDGYFHKNWAELSAFLAKGHGDLSAPAIAASGTSPTLLHAAYLEEYAAADIIVHDFPFTVNYDLFLGLDNKPRIYNSHNCESELYQELHASEKSRPIVELVVNAEKKLLDAADLILYCGENDHQAFTNIAPHKEAVMCYSPNGMIEQHRQIMQCRKQDKLAVVFVGSAHLPNVTAAKYIANELAPRCPSVRFDIIGNCLPEGKYGANVVRHGRISDEEKSAIFAQASLALNPMESGSGSNIKVLDYFSYALPILSTPFGMRGFEVVAGIHFIEGELGDFPALVQRHLEAENIEKTFDIGHAGLRLACENYTWGAIINRLLPVFDQLSKEERPFTLALNDYNSFTTVGGGATRTRGLYHAVNAISPVVFVCFSSDGQLTTQKYNDLTHVISVPKSAEHVQEVAELNAQFHISCDDIIASHYCMRNAMLVNIYNILKQSARFIVVEHPYMAPLPLSYHDRFVYSSHNDETKLKTELLEWHPQKAYLLDLVVTLEKNAVEKSAFTIAVSDDDAYSLLEGKNTAGPMMVVRNGSEPPVAISDEVKRLVEQKVEKHSAVFLGSAHMPNVDAVNYLLKEVAPKCPEVQFNIVGSVCESISVASSKNVVLWGKVDEETKCAILQRCMFAVNPVVSGSGSNIKLADFFANGLFVVSTTFGLRGYPDEIRRHTDLTELDSFADAVRALSPLDEKFSDEMRRERQEIFYAELSMAGIGKKFVSLLEELEKPKRRVLFATYRYTHPELGGAESHIKRFLQALGATDEFAIDVITTNVSRLSNRARFAEQYEFDETLSAPIEMRNLRFGGFSVENDPGVVSSAAMRLVWQVQPAFEKAVVAQLLAPLPTGLAWGWAHPEGDTAQCYRWGYAAAGINLANAATVTLTGYVPETSQITLQAATGGLYLSQEVSGNFTLNAAIDAGMLEIYTSASAGHGADPRPLGFILHELRIDNEMQDLTHPMLADARQLPAEGVFDILSNAAEQTRFSLHLNLTDIRGPHSAAMERFINVNIAKYDLVITHNSVFKPASLVIDAAHRHNVPSLLIPHAHLDDDYYHFPDLLDTARKATKVLTVPKAASEFYARKGCQVVYLPAGADVEEEFMESDRQAFSQIYGRDEAFVLTLGRKSGAKGYHAIIKAVEDLNRAGNKIRLVMIGPDDDGATVDSPCVSYLERQPREVVRGALMSCQALVNMSSSESFGIVLLEAWLAKKPVIANKHCVAFHDMAVDEQNALLVDARELPAALTRILNESELRERLGKNGFETAQRFSWEAVENEFVAVCRSVSR
ncbi:TPA: glycosyltransferase [Enterobacter asburiae]|uniref:glycosyltransferase n=1 Tax=Enterobacter sp. EC_64 TaxID=2584092 RepID=UPI001C705970|nr:glycosyltransferase [Enterobacter sp. EC_64]MBW9384857.1 glycosyltransferase [Enterobacter sp. EC_64]